MSQRTVYVCEGCGVECASYAATKGWVHLCGSIARYHGKMGPSCYTSDYISGSVVNDHHFCSVGCIEKALNKAGEEARECP